MTIQAFRPIPEDNEAIALRLTAHPDDETGETLTGVDVMLRWHKTPNENKNKVWSGEPEITIQGPTDRLPPDEIEAVRNLLATAVEFALRISDDPSIVEDIPEQWTVAEDA